MMQKSTTFTTISRVKSATFTTILCVKKCHFHYDMQKNNIRQSQNYYISYKYCKTIIFYHDLFFMTIVCVFCNNTFQKYKNNNFFFA
jgi:hypothetical protein